MLGGLDLLLPLVSLALVDLFLGLAEVGHHALIGFLVVVRPVGAIAAALVCFLDVRLHAFDDRVKLDPQISQRLLSHHITP